MNNDYLETLKRLGIICLMYKDRFGTGLFMPTMLEDSRLTFFTKLLNLVNNQWLVLKLERFLPVDIVADDFYTWLMDSKIEYVNKETYLTMSYKNMVEFDTHILELPAIGPTEKRCHLKTRIYYNLIPDIVLHLLQRTNIETCFPTKFHVLFTSCVWDEIHGYLKEARKKFLAGEGQ